MTDLEINVALAKAMGWVKYDNIHPLGSYKKDGGLLYCWSDWCFRKFDYRDIVIFVAICKHWQLNIYHRYGEASFVCDNGTDYTHENESIEKAAALCVIEIAKGKP